VPLHATTADQLRLYAQERKRLHYDGLSDAFFVCEQGSHLCYNGVWQTFVCLVNRAGIRHDEDNGRPYIHGLRHSFAVVPLLDWYRRGLLVNDLLPTLSFYMGHVKPANTYWYLTTTPELRNAGSPGL
jgi:integrase/recombinase XerD